LRLDSLAYDTYLNLSKKKIHPKLDRILKLGLKFCPCPPDTTNAELRAATGELCRFIALRDFFKNKTSSIKYDPRLPLPISDWMPLELKDAAEISRSIENEVCNALAWEKGLNIKPHEVSPHASILRQLPKDIVACSADKNLGLVLLNVYDYHALVMHHLCNGRDYQPVAMGRTEFLADLRHQHTRLLEKVAPLVGLRSQAFRFLQQTRAVPPKFHVLPKLHKWDGAKVELMPTRPIAGAVNWITTRWSQWINTVLQDELSMPHVLKDSRQLLQLMEGFRIISCVPMVLFTADADSLYTNIDVATLLDSIHMFKPTLTEFVAFVLNNSIVEYAGTLYHQLRGIPMGTNCAVHLANLYLNNLVDKKAATHPKIPFYWRYIDDCIGLFRGTRQEAEQVLKPLLDDPERNLSWNFNLIEWRPGAATTPLPFLDASIYISADGFVYHRPYTKPTHKGLYLPYSSCHPKSTMRGFIRGESIRLCILSSFRTDYAAALAKFWHALRLRGYPRVFLSKVNVAKFDERKSLLFPETKKALDATTAQVAPFKIQFSRRPVLRRIQSAMKRISNEKAAQKLKLCLLTAYRRPPNTASIIVRSSLTPAQLAMIKNANKRTSSSHHGDG
jgi:hypothetical protein